MQNPQVAAEQSLPLLVLTGGSTSMLASRWPGVAVQSFAAADELAQAWLAAGEGVILLEKGTAEDSIRRLRSILPDAPLVAIADLADELTLLQLGVQEVITGGGSDLRRIMARALVRSRLSIEHSRAIYQDPLTGLPNRTLFLDRLEHTLLQAKRQNQVTGLLYLGGERFRIINELHGYAMGDELLIASAQRLQNAVRSSDTLARIGGDVFAVVLSDIRDEHTLMRVADKIRQAFTQPFHCSGTEVFLHLSIGMELSERVNNEPALMLRHAELAMHRVRREDHRRTMLYQDDSNSGERITAGLESALYHALERNELRLEYQPQVGTLNGAFTGVEVLLRWTHPLLGDVSPDVFIPVLEETGLITRFGEWVLRVACEQFAGWQQQRLIPPEAHLSVNLSPRQFGQPELVARVHTVLEETGLNPQQLTLEITEGTLMRNMGQGVTMLNELRQLGVAIAIDDFGTGYSSLAYLKDLPIDYLKIDRLFVKDVVTNQHDAAIANSIISLAHNLGLKVIAEGVEDSEILEMLKVFGCDQYQGFYFSRPVRPQEIPALAARCG